MNLSLFAQAFPFIFIAALPGRTTFVMLVMAARGRPWGIFWGAALAFAAQSLISVMLGTVLSLLPQGWVQLGAGLLFLGFAFLFWKESRRTLRLEVDPAGGKTFWTVARSAFLLVFAAEWGDVSQVAIASFTSSHSSQAVVVFVSAVLALWVIAGMAVTAGFHLKKALRPAQIQKAASLVFTAIGIYLIVSGARALFTP
jgi:putative Ca2+/H+ antiporter (TMEM165/GDT1 family)